MSSDSDSSDHANVVHRRPRKCRAVAVDYDEDKRRDSSSESDGDDDDDAANSEGNVEPVSVEEEEEVVEAKPSQTTVALFINGIRLDFQHTEGDQFLQCSAFATHENGHPSLHSVTSSCTMALPSVDAIPHNEEGIAEASAFHTWIWNDTDNQQQQQQRQRSTRKRVRYATLESSTTDKRQHTSLTTVLRDWFLMRNLPIPACVSVAEHPMRAMLSTVLHELVYEVDDDDLLMKQYALDDTTVLAAGQRLERVQTCESEKATDGIKTPATTTTTTHPNLIAVQFVDATVTTPAWQQSRDLLRKLRATYSDNRQRKLLNQRCRVIATEIGMRHEAMRVMFS